MAAYTYRARDGSGTLVRGRLEAAGEREAVARLRAQGMLVLDLEPDRDLGRALRFAPALGRTVRPDELALFLRQFATMIQAGLPIVAALRVLERQSQSRSLRRALEQAVAEVETGETLAASLARSGAFPRLVVHMIGAGEVGGILDRVLDRMATQLEREEAVRQKIRSALVYPLVVSSLAVLVVTFLVTFVVPKFVQFFSDMGGQLPLPTRMLLAASDFVHHWWWLLLAGLVLAILGVRHWARTDRGALSLDRAFLRLPVMGPLIGKYGIARFCRILSGLMGSGIPILKALAVAEKVVGNRQLGRAILGALDSVRKGNSLVEPLARSRLFPPMVVEMISVGEESGTIEPMLLKVAEFYEDEVQRSAERLSSALEPFLLFLLAVVVGGLVLGMVAPVFDLWTLIQ